MMMWNIFISAVIFHFPKFGFCGFSFDGEIMRNDEMICLPQLLEILGHKTNKRTKLRRTSDLLRQS